MLRLGFRWVILGSGFRVYLGVILGLYLGVILGLYSGIRVLSLECVVLGL